MSLKELTETIEKNPHLTNTRSPFWEDRESYLFVGIVCGYFLCKGRLFSTRTEAKSFGLTAQRLFFEDLSFIFNILKKHYFGITHKRSGKTCERRLKELRERQRDMKGERLSFTEMYGKFIELNIKLHPGLFQMGMHQLSEAHVIMIASQPLPVESDAEQKKGRSTCWKEFEEVILIGVIMKHFFKSFSLFPSTNSQGWTGIVDDFKREALSNRKDSAIRRHFKTMRKQIRKQERSGFQDLYEKYVKRSF